MEPLTRRHAATPLLALALLGAPAIARAQTATLAAAAEDTVATERTAWIQGALDAETPAADRWYFGWTVAQGALALGQGIAAPFVRDPVLQPNLYIGAASGLLGALPMAVAPLRACFTAGELRATPGRTPDERRARLRRAERLLREAAQSEDDGRSWVWHALGIAGSVAAGLVLWLGYHQADSGALTAGIGVAATELQIWSQPMGASSAWRAYVRDHSGEVAILRDNAPRARPAGAGVAVTF